MGKDEALIQSLETQLATATAQLTQKEAELSGLRETSTEKLQRQEIHIKKLVQRYCDLKERYQVLSYIGLTLGSVWKTKDKMQKICLKDCF
jgi:hypothetical protein